MVIDRPVRSRRRTLPLGIAWIVTGARLVRGVPTVSAVALVVTTAIVASTFISFLAGGGQDVGSLWVLVAYGPAWMLFGFDLRAPAQPVLAAAG